MPICELCGKSLSLITNTHLNSAHNYSVSKYIKKFGIKGCGFVFPHLLPKNDPRFLKWRESLKKRPSWNKGFTKETHPGLAKLVKTFKERKIDNFAKWREEAKKNGLIKADYPSFKKSTDLAFLTGLVLGDGHIQNFPRTEALTVALGTDKPKLWKYVVGVIKRVFEKSPFIQKAKDSECMRIRVYQRNISKRLGIPIGNRSKIKNRIPYWINNNKDLLISYLKGLFEAEGSFSIHLPTCTYNFQFSNRNSSLLNIVENALIKLGFHPERRINSVRLRKRAEALNFEKLINFRKY